MRLGRGTAVLVTLDPTISYEQQGVRPCVVVTDPKVGQLAGQCDVGRIGSPAIATVSA